MLKRYGGITLATYAPETNSDMILAPRNSRYEVVQQILDDLDEAISRLKNTTKSSTGNNGQVTIEAANALKARVCLFEGTWENIMVEVTLMRLTVMVSNRELVR